MLTALSGDCVTAGRPALFERRHVDLCRVTTSSCPTGMHHR